VANQTWEPPKHDDHPAEDIGSQISKGQRRDSSRDRSRPKLMRTAGGLINDTCSRRPNSRAWDINWDVSLSTG